jgi:hypothetical protein
MAKKLTKVNKIGEWAFHVFVSPSDVEIVEPISIEEYNGIENTQISKPGLTWKYSLIAPKFDTPSGFLEDDSYAFLESGEICLKIKGMKTFEFPTQRATIFEGVEGLLSDDTLSHIQAVYGLTKNPVWQ